MDWWRDPLGELVGGRRVILAGGPAAVWTPIVGPLRDLGAAGRARRGHGRRWAPVRSRTRQIVAVEIPDDADADGAAAHGDRAGSPTRRRTIVEAVEAFDPDRDAVVFGTFLTESPTLVGRPLVAHRRPEWVALEDKTTVDALLDRAGVVRAPSVTVDVGDAAAAVAAVRSRVGHACGRSTPATASTAAAPARAG